MVVAAGVSTAAGQRALPDVPSAITSDSTPGWAPSESQKQNALQAARDYFSKLDNERYDNAYAMMSEANRRTVPAEQFTRNNKDFRSRSGSLSQRSLLKVTWTKDPAGAPRGIYAAVDVGARYSNVDRYCGYVVLYQKSAGDSFEIMRQEANFIENAVARDIEQKKSRAELDNAWAKLAANCPGYTTGTPN
ncbi:DUF4019 domain-containing protein [Bradyrhizobium lablabi]|uniref:DUF4019 domain-containing protein n=1 Tax=Bradyrhizobium lablabi TaxID=722472 RepID=UPI001BA611C9|nr:DUF4019 domain-containing protein [Bradyrhizobium lablabi]MBR1120217.1 DUF4019 domain-containing protein [Bradyrhizobium lablabi]